ncbi:hypothetical protein TWF481_008553 [Arthrobotrys musiformis]|uniref:Cytochrome b561 domain-containing protein n=1 Tax=Arthrobotrys musiformis TaxID=47236 RepID=A0AAV9W7H5_9PEZI
MADNNGPRGYRDGVYFVDVNAYVLPPLIGLPFHDMRLNGEGARHRGDTNYYKLIVVHAVFMCLAMLLFLPFAIFQARFRAYRNPRRAIRSHIVSNCLTLLFLSIGFACGVSATGKERAWTNPHHIIGLTIYVAVWVQVLLGAIVHHRGKFKVTPHLPLRTMLHRWLGRAVWLLSLAQIPLGLTLYGSPLSLFILYAVYVFLLLMLYFTSEFYRGRQHGTATVTTETAFDYQNSEKHGHSEHKGFLSGGNLAKIGLGFLVAKKVKDHYAAREDMTADQSELSSRPGYRPPPGRRQHAGYASSVGVTNSEVNGGYNRTELTAYTGGTGYTYGTGYTTGTGYTNGTGYTTGTGYTNTEDVESRMSPPRTSHGGAAKAGLLGGLMMAGAKSRGVDTRPDSNAKPGFFAGIFKRNKKGDDGGASPKKLKKGGLTGDGGWFDRRKRNRESGMSAVHTEDYSDSEDDEESRRRDGSPSRRGVVSRGAGAAAVGAAAGMAAAHHRDRRHSASSVTDSYFTDPRPTERVNSMPATGGLQAPPPAQNNYNNYSNHRLPIGHPGAPGYDPHNIHNDQPTFTGVPPPVPPFGNPPTLGIPPRPPIPATSTRTHSRQDSSESRPRGLGFIIPPEDPSDSELSIEPHNRPSGSRSYRIPQTVTSGSETGSEKTQEHYIPQAALQVRIKKKDGGKTVTTIKRMPNRERASIDSGAFSPGPSGRQSSRSADRRDDGYRVREERRRAGAGGGGGADSQSDREMTDQEELRREREARRERRRQRRETHEYYYSGDEIPPQQAAYT